MTWDAWVSQHAAAALLYARQIARSEPDALDAVQDGFIRFWRNRHDARDPVGLLFACIRTAALDRHRGEKRRIVREHHLMQHQLLLQQSPGESAERREEIERALAALPADQREVVVLKIWGGLTFAQIVRATGESPNTAASRYRYAMEKLAALLRITEVQP